MNHPRSAPSRPGRLNVWVVGVLAASAAALTAWGLTSRADAPPTANQDATTRSDTHYNFMGFADLEQGVAPLYPLQPGRVVKVFAHDGDAVEADAPLFTMDDKMAMDQIDAAEADLRNAQLQLEEAQKFVAQHQQQIDGQKQAVEARKQEAAAGRAKADEAEKLHGSQNASAETVRARPTRRRKLWKRRRRGEEAKLHILELDDPSLAVKRAENAVEAKQSQLRKAQMGLRECTVWAPAKGVVERMDVSEGESLGPNPRQPAVMFAADGPRIVRAEVEQEWAGHVALGAPL